MKKLLISIYDWFERHKVVFYVVLIGLFVLCGLGATKVQIEEDFSTLFNLNEDQEQYEILNNDKIVVALSGQNVESITKAADIFADYAKNLIDKGLVLSVTDTINESQITGRTELVLGTSNTKDQDLLLSELEDAAEEVAALGAKTDFAGSPVIAVYNMRQVKKDIYITLLFALIIILVVVLFSFKNEWSTLLILLSPLFGKLFASAIVGLACDSISVMALGMGVIVVMLSLCYSIHVVSNGNYTNDPHRIIQELSHPLTLGCLTTIVAFIALMFTHSPVLQDIGLYAALILTGNLLFLSDFPSTFCGKNETYRAEAYAAFH